MKVLSDVRLAVRQLTRAPGFAASVVVTLAIGLGVNTSVFLFVNDFFLRPLPVKHPDFLDFRRAVAGDGGEGHPAMAAAFSDLLAYQQLPVALGQAEAGAERTWVAAVSDNFFSTLGLQAAHGRLFAANEGRSPGADPIIVMTEACWRSRVGADPGVIGQQVTINALTFTIVGVTPKGFHGVQWSDG